jgi:hypothetical protein
MIILSFRQPLLELSSNLVAFFVIDDTSNRAKPFSYQPGGSEWKRLRHIRTDSFPDLPGLNFGDFYAFVSNDEGWDKIPR